VHNNFYFLRQLSLKLNERISGYSIVSCFSQSKDELVIELNNSSDSFFIRANLEPTFCCLSFPDEFHRARKNSVDLFTPVLQKKVVSVRQFENERSFIIKLENQLSLIFKMHGNFANVLFIRENKVEGIFRNHLQTDFETSTLNLDRKIDFSRENFEQNIHLLNSTFFTLGKVVFDYWKEKGFDQSDQDGKWQIFHETILYLEKPKYYIIERNGRLIFSLHPFGKIVEEHLDPILAISSFADRTIRDQALFLEKRDALSELQVRLKNSEAYVSKGKAKLIELEHDQHYQLWADLIMANLHSIKQGVEKISLTDFYDGMPVEIKLKKELNPQRNAEVFYRKAKNHQIEINKLRESIQQKEKDVVKFNGSVMWIEEAEDLKTLRERIKLSGIAKKSSIKIEPLPYREFEFKNYKIWVGKSAEGNDKLTLKYSYKEDLWLHAKDVAGSHVLIKHQAGKNFPKDVIEYAASLAASYSKRKSEAFCPVAVTPKKFVRKRKGDPAGTVVVEREEVILVSPLKRV